MEKEYLAVKSWVIKELVDFLSKEVLVDLLHKNLTVDKINNDPKLLACSVHKTRQLCYVLNTAKLSLGSELNLNYTLMKISHLDNINAFSFRVLEDWSLFTEESILLFYAKISDKIQEEVKAMDFIQDYSNYTLVEKILTTEQLDKFQEVISNPQSSLEIMDKVNKLTQQQVIKLCAEKINSKNLSYQEWLQIKDDPRVVKIIELL